jgi:transmembrane sensor
MKPENKYIDLISKSLTKQTTESEDLELFNWLKSGIENKKTFDELKTAWELTEKNYEPDSIKINLNEEWQLFKSNLPIQESESRRKTVPIYKQAWIRVAASLLILIGIGSGIFYLMPAGKKSVEANHGIVVQHMPDGSEISLNKNSKILYKNDYNKKGRAVQLEGEAFFKVTADSTRPFVVRIDDFRIKVLGTSFNINQDKKTKTIHVSVVSGKVLVYNQAANSNSLVLVAGESASYNSSNRRIHKDKGIDPNHLAWKTKNFTFENAELGYIVKTLNQSYQANILILNSELEKCKITLTLKGQSLESALKVIEATLEIKVQKKGDIIEISGNGCSGI